MTATTQDSVLGGTLPDRKQLVSEARASQFRVVCDLLTCGSVGAGHFGKRKGIDNPSAFAYPQLRSSR